jgi:hypothetical protein
MVESISNRCFPTEAVAAWLALDMARRAGLGAAHLRGAGIAEVLAEILAEDCGSDPLIAVEGRIA